MNKMRCLAKRPDSDWYVTFIDNSLKALQEFVGGYIEVVQIYGDMAIICNEEGRIYNLPYNCTICGVSFCGNILVVGTDGEEFTHLDQDILREWGGFVAENVEE